MSTAPKQSSDFPTPQPDTAGIPDVVRDLMLVAPFNDLDVLASLLEAGAGADIGNRLREGAIAAHPTINGRPVELAVRDSSSHPTVAQ